MPLLDPAAPPRSIVIVRLSARGDVVFATALIPALRRAFPDARITWVVEEAARDLVEANPRLDRVVVMPRARWGRDLRSGRLLSALAGVRAFVRELRSEPIDLALDVQGILRSGLVAWLSGAKRRIGLGSKEGSGVLMHDVVASETHGFVRVSSEYVHLARELGLEATSFPMDVAPAPEARAEADARLRAEGLETGRYVVFAPFTTRPQKHWFAERWAELAGRVAARFGLPVVVLGGPGDRAAMERIADLAEAGVHDFVGATRLGEAAEVVRRAAAVVGVDTGLTQIAVAFRRPTVALFGSTLPWLETPESVSRVVHEPMHCSPCRKRPTCGGAWSCMRALGVGRVETALAEVLAESGALPEASA
ncbi:MAG: glycosyltransferase family 9 protein [Longimicrobiales bacterium]|nr:glycosyltransferase family 9 protein [Longimicrobiales bacterium]